MTTIFVSHTEQDAACAEQIRQGLEAQGYSTWREPRAPDLNSLLYPKTIEDVILGSAAYVLLWSSSAQQSEWVERHTLFAQRLKKLILPVLLDATHLPNTLVVQATITGQSPCTDVVAQLKSHLPLPDSQDPLMALSERAAHNFIRLRKEAIDEAAAMLKRGEQREAVLALLEYLARNDTMMGVREKAQEILDAEARKSAPPAPAGQSRHIFDALCKTCGHVTYFNKQHVCRDEQFVREIRQRGGTQICKLDLNCGHCGAELKVSVDCGGYR